MEEWALWGRNSEEGKCSYKEGQAGELAGRQTDRQTVPSSSCCLHLPLTIPQKVLFLVLSPVLSFCVKFELSPVLGWSGWRSSGLNLISTDGSRYKHLIQDGSSYKSPEGCTHYISAVALPRQHPGGGLPERWLGGPHSSTGLDWGPTLLTGANVFCKLLCISTGFSSVCRPILFTGKQQQHLCIYTVIKESFCSRAVF